MMQNIDCELEPQVQLGSGLRSQGERKELVCSLMRELLGNYSDPCYKSGT